MPDITDLGFPFPLGSDPVAHGAADIEELAEDVDAWFNTYAKLSRSAVQAFADNSPAVVNWTVSDLSADFSLVDVGGGATTGGLQYDGPDRFFAWRYGLKFPAGLSGTATALFREAGTVVAGDDKYIPAFGTFPQIGGYPLCDSGLVFLETGMILELTAEQTSGASRNVTPFMSVKGL